MDRIAAANNLHSWQVELQFYGSEKSTLANWEWAKELILRSRARGQLLRRRLAEGAGDAGADRGGTNVPIPRPTHR